jgi:hypothetical protein
MSFVRKALMRALSPVVLCLLWQPGTSHTAPGLQGSPAADAESALACVQDALGGTRAFADVRSLRLRADTRPTAASGPAPPPGQREMVVVLPDRYRRSDFGLPPTSGGTGGLSSVIGFDRSRLLSSPRGFDPKVSLVRARQDFERQMLMRLPRKLPGVRLMQRVVVGSSRERLALDAVGSDGSTATLLVDRRTCVPVALQYTAFGSVTRVELSDYRAFGGIRLPTVLTSSVNGQPFAEERVSAVELNTADAETYFPATR